MANPSPYHPIDQLVEAILRSLCDKQDDIKLQFTEGAEMIVCEIRVATEDVGKVIGKMGRHLEAIRLLVRSAARKLPSKRVVVEICNTQARMRDHRYRSPEEEKSYREVWDNPAKK